MDGTFPQQLSNHKCYIVIAFFAFINNTASLRFSKSYASDGFVWFYQIVLFGFTVFVYAQYEDHAHRDVPLATFLLYSILEVSKK